MNKHPSQNGLPACHCGSDREYALCCGRYHHGVNRLQAPDPQTLMRSRYCAYVLDDIAYLLETWHPDTRPSLIEPNETGTQWLGLKVIEQSFKDPDHASVEFVARVRNPQGRAIRLHENSQFVRQNGYWFYIDGEMLR